MALEPRVIWSCESPGAVGVPPPPVLTRWAVFLSALARAPLGRPEGVRQGHAVGQSQASLERVRQRRRDCLWRSWSRGRLEGG